MVGSARPSAPRTPPRVGGQVSARGVDRHSRRDPVAGLRAPLSGLRRPVLARLGRRSRPGTDAGVRPTGVSDPAPSGQRGRRPPRPARRRRAGRPRATDPRRLRGPGMGDLPAREPAVLAPGRHRGGRDRPDAATARQAGAAGLARHPVPRPRRRSGRDRQPGRGRGRCPRSYSSGSPGCSGPRGGCSRPAMRSTSSPPAAAAGAPSPWRARPSRPPSCGPSSTCS
jgi:hypothetical protein